MDKKIRLALAAQAYRDDLVRLVDHDLRGCEHLVATRHGLFAIDTERARLVAYGQYYGVAVRGDVIFAFEACDRPRHRTFLGRIVWFRHDGVRVLAAGVFAAGLDNGCHQMDFIDDRLHLLDTYNQRVLRFPRKGGAPDIMRPIAGGENREWTRGYVHINSLIAVGKDILLLLHNGADRTGRPSEIARFDRDWRLIDRSPLDGLGCHGFAILEDGAILSCGSLAGELVSTGGLRVKVCDMMTRGLSVDDRQIVVGGSAFAERSARDEVDGKVFFLDRDYRRFAEVPVVAPPMEIRRIDGRDRSLSTHLASIGATESIPKGRPPDTSQPA